MRAMTFIAVLAGVTCNSPADTWLDGARFRRQLGAHVNIVWREVPLREALASLAQSQRVAIMLDRRIDPGQVVNFSVRNEPLSGVLQKLAEENDLGISFVDSVIYVSPRPTAAKLAALLEATKADVKRLPPAARKKWQQSTPLQWDDLAEPRQLLAQIERQTSIRISGQGELAHDLWPAGSWPPLPAASKLVLLLAGFELSPRVEPDGSCSIVPMPD
jgi:hypothetical protein